MSEVYIRFDGPPGPVSGRFIEVERDGASISIGEWRDDGDDCLLVLTEYTKLEAVAEAAEDFRKSTTAEDWVKLNAALNALIEQENLTAPTK